jgi:phosphoribosylformylglycinamidine cyclo-ligase
MKSLSYAAVGVDAARRRRAKKTISRLESLDPRGTIYGPWGKLLRDPSSPRHLLLHGTDGVGTKVFLSEALDRHSTVGQDLVAMLVNDTIRMGAKPLHLNLSFDVRRSEPELMAELFKGVMRAAKLAGAIIASGENADVPEMMLRSHVSKYAYALNATCLGRVERSKVILGNRIMAGDVVIGLPSSGVHSNGVTLARRALFSQWGGAYSLNERIKGFSKPLGEVVLAPTEIYVKPVLDTMARFDVTGAAHVTGEAYSKLATLLRFAPHAGLRLTKFSPHPVFGLIQKAAKDIGSPISDEEMFRTFNMGYGFLLVVRPQDAAPLVQRMRRFGVAARRVGEVTERAGEIRVEHAGKIHLLNR